MPVSTQRCHKGDHPHHSQPRPTASRTTHCLPSHQTTMAHPHMAGTSPLHHPQILHCPFAPLHPELLVASAHTQGQPYTNVEPYLGPAWFNSAHTPALSRMELSIPLFPLPTICVTAQPRIRALAAKRWSCLSNRSAMKVQGLAGLAGIPSAPSHPQAEAASSHPGQRKGGESRALPAGVMPQLP